MKKALIFLSLLLGGLVSVQASVLDSVGVEKKGDAYFIQHRMEAKETLYALSRRYNATVDEIKKANPGVNINDIGIGQIILVPAKNYRPLANPAATAVASSGKKVHKVEPKETLFALSQKYGITVDELKKANPVLNEKGLQVGMELVIPGKSESAPTVAQTKKPEPVSAAKPVQNTSAGTATTTTTTTTAATKPASPTAAKPKPEPATARLTPTDLPAKNSKIEKVNENGLAEAAPARQDAPDFFAYHKTAPVGTIILVVNDQNNQNAYVRVIGHLVNPSSEATIIQLSPKAMERIKAGDTKPKVSLSYFMP